MDSNRLISEIEQALLDERHGEIDLHKMVDQIEEAIDEHTDDGVDVHSQIHGRIRSFLVDELDVTEVDADRIADVGTDSAVSMYHDLGYI